LKELASKLQEELENARKLRETQGQIPAKSGREVRGKYSSFLCANMMVSYR